MKAARPLVYLLASVIGFFGIAFAYKSFDANALLAMVAGNIGLAALLGALYQLIRDEAAHKKELWLQHDDHGFQVGATSHMANVVFDKHVIFCEAYIAEVNATMVTLIREHASLKAVEHANKLYTLRAQHATWVTEAMSAQLESFEDDLRRLGAKAGLIADTAGSARDGEQRAQAIKFVYEEFDVIMAHMMKKEQVDGKSIHTMFARVRKLLGIEELVEVRTELIQRTHKALVPRSRETIRGCLT